MTNIQATTVEEYLSELPKDRYDVVTKVREKILKSLPEGYEEGVQYKMIGYFVPLSRYPQGYLGDKKTPLPYAALASQKHHMALYLFNIYNSSENYEWFMSEYKKTGKKMDIGKSCVRFKKLEDLPLDLIAKVISKTSVKDYIKMYETSKRNHG